MACKSDVRIAILDKLFEEFTEGRYSFSRIGEDTIQINNKIDNSKSKVSSNKQAKAIANELLARTNKSFNGHINGYVSQISAYDPVTVTFTVSDPYITHEFNKLNLINKGEANRQEQERNFVNTSTDYNSYNQQFSFAPLVQTEPEIGVYLKFINFKKSLLSSHVQKLNKIKAAKRVQGVSVAELKRLNKLERELELQIEGSYERKIKGLKDEIQDLQAGASRDALAYYIEKDLSRLDRLANSNDINDLREANKLVEFYETVGTFELDIENPLFTQEEIFLTDIDNQKTSDYRLDNDVMDEYKKWKDKATGYKNQIRAKEKEVTTEIVNTNPGVKKTFNKKFSYSELIYEETGLKDTHWVDMWLMDITSGIFSKNGILPQVIFAYLTNSMENKAKWSREIEERIDKINPEVQKILMEKGYTLRGGGIIGLSGASYDLFKEISKEGNETGAMVQRFTKEFFDAQNRSQNTFRESFNKAKVIHEYSQRERKFNKIFEEYKNWKRNNTIILDINQLSEIVSDSEFSNLFTANTTIDDSHKNQLIEILGEKGYNEQIEEQKKLLSNYIVDKQNFIDTALTMEGKNEGEELSDENKIALERWEINRNPFNGIKDYNGIIGLTYGTKKANNFMGYNVFIPRKKQVKITGNRESNIYNFEDTDKLTNNYNKKFAEIENNATLLEFYNIVKEVSDTIKENIPYDLQKLMSPNTLPGLSKTFTELVADNNVGIIKSIFGKNGAIASFWEKIRLSFGVIKQADVSYAYLDPKTGLKNYEVNDSFLRNNNNSINQRQTIESIKFIQAYNTNKKEGKLEKIRKHTILPFSAMSTEALLLLAEYTHTDLTLDDIKTNNIGILKAKIGDKVEVGRLIKDYSVHSVVQAQTFDLAKLSKYFSNMTMAYAARQEALPLLEIIKKHYNNIKNPGTTNINVPIYNVPDKKYQSIGLRERGNRQINDWFERVVLDNYGKPHSGLIGNVKENALIGKVIYSVEDRKKLNEINTLIKNTNSNEEKVKLEKIKKELGKIRTATAAIDNLLSWIRTLRLGYNLSSAITNFVEGVTSNLVLAASNEYFDSRELFYGYHIAKQSFVKNLSFGLVETDSARKARKLMDMFNVVMDSKNELQKSSHKTYSSKLSWTGPHELNQRVEYLNQSPLMIAMLRTLKVKGKDGNESKIWDAFEWNKETNSYKLTDNYRTEENINNWENLSGEEYQLFKNKLNQVIVLAHGNYDELRGMMIKSNTAGKAIAMFKTWLPQQFYWRFATKQDNIATNTVGFKGRYLSNTATSALIHGAVVGTAMYGLPGAALFGVIGAVGGKLTKVNTGDSISLLQETIEITKQLFLKLVGMPVNLLAGKELINNGENAFENWVGKGTFTERDAKNLRANMADISIQLMWIAMILVVKGIFWDDDDEEDKPVYNVVINKLVQLSSQAAMYVSPVETKDNTIGSLAVVQYLQDLGKEIDRIGKWMDGTDIIASGVNTGESGLSIQTRKILLPGLFKDPTTFGFETQSKRVFTESPLHKYFKSDEKLDKEKNASDRAGRRAELNDYYDKFIDDKQISEEDAKKEIQKIIDQELPTPTRLKNLGMTREEYMEYLKENEQVK